VITGIGTISCAGGNGANAALNNGGGGGGGGGGLLVFVTQNDVTMTSLILNVAGGIGGAGLGTGASGSPGSIGRIYNTRV
jgi:hypothetical protein